jgi:DNA-binding CsgD family transcriptional regulator
VGLLTSYRNIGTSVEKLQKLLLILNQPPRPERIAQKTGRARQLRPHEIDELVERYEAGESMAKLARELGLHRSTISSHLHERGIQLHEAPQMSEAAIDKAVELYGSGLSLVAIGKRLGFNQATIHNQLKRREVVFRSPNQRRL